MWPLLFLLLLAGGKGPSKGPPLDDKPGDGGGGGGGGGAWPCSYTTPTQMGFSVPTAAEATDLTSNEYSAIVRIMKAFNDRLVGKPFITPWKVCNAKDVANIAQVPLDDLGALAMMVYWTATKSKESRPWPTEDLEVLAKPPTLNPFDPEAPPMSTADYLVWRIKHYKVVLKQYLVSNS